MTPNAPLIEPRAILGPAGPRLVDDAVTSKKIEVNLRRNKKQDKTELLDEAGRSFDYASCRHEYWNPEPFSLLYGTPLWDESTPSQRVVLNQLYWVAYYSQIISAEIATIFFNQTSAAGLFGVEDFRPVCDMLDLESSQERAHIAAFKRVAENVEATLFGERIFTYPMRGPYAETMIFQDSGPFKRRWKRLQLETFGLLSSGNAFIACQYFLVRGLRTLNGKIVQHQLSQYYQRYARPPEEGGQGRPEEEAPIPSKISYYHFCDESYHFNSSTIISHDLLKSLKAPTRFERFVTNLGVKGCQRDHQSFSSLLNGIFWYDPAAFGAVYRVLRSPVFGMDDKEARHMIERCFCEENASFHEAEKTHRVARESYMRYLEGLDFITAENREMRIMGQSSIEGAIARNRRAFKRARLSLSPAALPAKGSS